MSALNSTARTIFAEDKTANMLIAAPDVLVHTPSTCAKATSLVLDHPTPLLHPHQGHQTKNDLLHWYGGNISEHEVSLMSHLDTPFDDSDCDTTQDEYAQYFQSLFTTPGLFTDPRDTSTLSFTSSQLFQQQFQASSSRPSLSLSSSRDLHINNSTSSHNNGIADAFLGEISTPSSDFNHELDTSPLLQSKLHLAPSSTNNHQDQLCDADASQPGSSEGIHMQDDLCVDELSHSSSVGQDDVMEVDVNCYDEASKSWPTPLLYHRFNYYLQGYDYYKKKDLLHIIAYGARIHSDLTTDLSQEAVYNHSSAVNNHAYVSDKIKDELSNNRIAGPFKTKPPGLIVSPLALVEKKEHGKYRLIHNLSFPKHSDSKFSVNSLVPKDFSQVSYETLDDCLRIICHLGRNSLISKADIQNAFRILPVHKDDYKLLGFQWEGQFYVCPKVPLFHARPLNNFLQQYSGFYRPSSQ